MAAMTTALTVYSDDRNSRTYVDEATHTDTEPRLCIQKRIPAENGRKRAKNTFDVVFGTSDADGDPISEKIVLGASSLVPVSGQAADVTAAIALYRDFVASDAFVAMVEKSLYAQ